MGFIPKVIAFILGVVICFAFVLLGWGVFSTMLSELLPQGAVDFIAGLGFVPHFTSISRGLIDTRDVFYFFSVISVCLALNTFTLNLKKSA